MSTFRQNVSVPSTGHLVYTSLASTATNVTTGGWVKAGKCRAWLAVCKVNTFAAGTATFSIRCASDANGTGAAAITGCETLEMSAAGDGVLEMSDALVPAAKPYICIYCVTAGGTNVISATLLRLDPSHSPASQIT